MNPTILSFPQSRMDAMEESHQLMHELRQNEKLIAFGRKFCAETGNYVGKIVITHNNGIPCAVHVDHPVCNEKSYQDWLKTRA